jgi:hypothetical protein
MHLVLCRSVAGGGRGNAPVSLQTGRGTPRRPQASIFKLVSPVNSEISTGRRRRVEPVICRDLSVCRAQMAVGSASSLTSSVRFSRLRSLQTPAISAAVMENSESGLPCGHFKLNVLYLRYSLQAYKITFAKEMFLNPRQR